MKTQQIGVLAFMALSLSAGCRPAAEQGPPFGMRDVGRLPIRRVVLYQSGVCYIERRGIAKSNTLRLRVRPDQVMDVLKSLTVVDFRGGRAVTVSLPAERSKLLELSQLPPQVRQSGGLLAIASAFRGASAIVTTARGTFRGRIVGVENTGTARKPDWRLTLLRNGVLTSHPVTAIRSMRVLDKTLTLGLEKSLDVALNKGRWKPVALTIRLSGKPPHELVVSYIVPMTAWKPAYRIVTQEGSDKALLQGWAVVDNLSGADWYRVRLSLTAGKPISFIYDLYTPREVKRPDLTPRGRLVSAAPPRPHAATAPPRPVFARPKLKRRAERRRRAVGVGGMPRALETDRVQEERELALEDYRRSQRASAAGQSVGSLFRFDIPNPVSIPDRSSALVSVVNELVPGKEVLYLPLESGRRQPYRAVTFRNTTDALLEGGPVAIYRKGAFVGEALLGRVEKGALAFVPYALEGRVFVHQEERRRDEGVRLVKIDRGYVTVDTQLVSLARYRVTNRTGKAMTLYVTRPVRAGWTLVAPKGVVRERDVYFVPIPLKASGETTFVVKEQTPVRRVLSVLDPRVRKAMALLVKGPLPESQRQAFRRVLAVWEQLGDVESRMETLRESMKQLRTRLKEVRENLRVLGTKGNRTLRRKLAATMAGLEMELNKLNRRWVELNMRRGDLKRRLHSMLRRLRFRRK